MHMCKGGSLLLAAYLHIAASVSPVIFSHMPHSWESQCMAWPDFTDSSFSESGNPRSWSNFTDSDQVMHTQALHAQPPSSVQVHKVDSWSPCPSWSASDWSPCPLWSASENGSHHQQVNWDVESLQGSHPSDKYDEDYKPGSKFSLLIHAPKTQSEINASDCEIQLTPSTGMSLCILFVH
jgi:hypothetical protein